MIEATAKEQAKPKNRSSDKGGAVWGIVSGGLVLLSALLDNIDALGALLVQIGVSEPVASAVLAALGFVGLVYASITKAKQG